MADTILQQDDSDDSANLLRDILETLPYTYAYNEPTEDEKQATLEHRRKQYREGSKRFRIRHPEIIKLNNKHYWASHPEETRAYSAARRARLRKAEGTHTPADIQAQLKRQEGRCYYCGVKLDKGYDVDHVVPITRGGNNDPSNLVIACPTCNRSKGDKLIHEWSGNNGRLL